MGIVAASEMQVLAVLSRLPCASRMAYFATGHVRTDTRERCFARELL